MSQYTYKRCGEEEKRNTAGNNEENRPGLRKDWSECSRGKRCEGPALWMPAFIARTGAKLSHTQVEKPGIRLRSRLLQPSEDLGARSTTGIVDRLTVLSSSLSPLNWGLHKEVWRKSRVCTRALLCFQLFYLFWFSGKMEGEHRYCVLVYILYRTSPRFNRYLASLSLNCPIFLYRGNICFLFLL